MRIHEIDLDGYEARWSESNSKRGPSLATWGSFGLERLHLNQGEGWQGMTVTATFLLGDNEKTMVADADGMVDVPPQALAEAGNGVIVFSGDMAGAQRITADIRYKVIDHSEVRGDVPEPTPDAFHQYIEQTNQYREEAAESAASAAASAQQAAASADGAAGSAEKAGEYADNAYASANVAALQATNAKNSAAAAADSAEAAAASAAEAAGSEASVAADAEAARQAASAAAASETAAASSASAAKTSETNAASSKTAAANSATAAASSAGEAADSAAAAADSAEAAAASAAEAAGSEASVAADAEAARQAASAAAASETAAASSASAAKTSETNAASSKTAAANSATEAAESAGEAADSATAAAASKTAAASSASAAKTSETNAASSKTAAASSATAAASSAGEAADSAAAAADSAEAAAASAEEAEAIANVGEATPEKMGLMSPEDKAKLDGIAEGANKTTVDSALSSTSTNPVQNKAVQAALAGKAASSHTHSAMKGATSTAAGGAGFAPAPAAGAQVKYLRGDGTWQTPPNTTYAPATQSANGLMSAADKAKFDSWNVRETLNTLRANDYYQLSKCGYYELDECSVTNGPAASSNIISGAFIVMPMPGMSDEHEVVAQYIVANRYGTGDIYNGDGDIFARIIRHNASGIVVVSDWAKIITEENRVTSTQDGLMRYQDKAKLDKLSEDSIRFTYTHSRTEAGAHTLKSPTGKTGNAIRFKATADFLTGDSFNISEVASSSSTSSYPITKAVTQDGEELPGAFFKEGSWVECYLDDEAKVLFFKGGGGLSDAKLAAADAEPGEVLEGVKFYAGDKTLKTGTMPNQGAKTILYAGSDVAIPKGWYNGSGKVTVDGGNQGAKTTELGPGGTYMIPKGWHNGNGRVTAPSMASLTAANAEGRDIISGKTAWVNGSKITGTLQDLGRDPKGTGCTLYNGGVYIYVGDMGSRYALSRSVWYPEGNIKNILTFSGSGSSGDKSGSYSEIYRNESNVTREIQARSHASASISGKTVTITVHAEAYQRANDIPSLSGTKSSVDYSFSFNIG